MDRRDERAEALREADGSVIEVHLAVIRSTADYATCLHEIGHILGPYQYKRSLLTRERWAWTWAREHTLIWTPDMKQTARASLQWHAARNLS